MHDKGEADIDTFFYQPILRFHT